MKIGRFMVPMILVASLSACMQPEAPSRNLTLPQGVAASGGTSSAPSTEAATFNGQVVMASQYAVASINVTVPRSLVASEANTFRPNADIVWRGDAPGDRHAQVAAIFQKAIATGTASMTSGRQVALDIEVTRFHGVTEKTRFTIGGVHSMHFILTVRDAATGEILQPPHAIVADVKAAGGSRAIAEDRAGRTQHVVVEQRLAEVIRRELSVPVGAMPQNAVITRFDGSAVAMVVAAQ